VFGKKQRPAKDSHPMTFPDQRPSLIRDVKCIYYLAISQLTMQNLIGSLGVNVGKTLSETLSVNIFQADFLGTVTPA